MELGRLPNKLRFFRHAHGYSQKKVASILGLCDAGILSRWEHGCTMPALPDVFRLAWLYHTQPHELYRALWDTCGTESTLLAHESELHNTNHFLLL